MAKYSEKLKQTMAAKILTPGGPSALSLAGKTGISQSTLSKWARKYKTKGGIILSELQRRPKDWSRAERLQALIDSAQLSGTDLGGYLRKQGLTTAHLEKWKLEFISGEVTGNVGRPAKDPEIKKLEKEAKDLKREIHRKDKALAETAALLVLKKKAQAIWGTPEDGE